MLAGRIMRTVAVVALVACGLVAAPTAVRAAGAAPEVAAQQWGVAEEQAFVARINGLRAGLGLAPLAVDAELTAQARIWAQTMKDAGYIFHTSDLAAGITADWQKLGENVGVGGTVDALFDAFVQSPKHYENLVDPTYRFVGIGVVWDGQRMFTAHRFMALAPPAPPTTATPAPTSTAGAAARTTTTEAPEELAAAEPAPPPAPSPTPAPASAAQVALVWATLTDAFDTCGCR